MIVSASRRTDIPCFYAEWMMNRFRAGYALARNPMNHAQLARVPLTPDVVDCVVFWTKDAANLLPRLGELEDVYKRQNISRIIHILEIKTPFLQEGRTEPC